VGPAHHVHDRAANDDHAAWSAGSRLCGFMETGIGRHADEPNSRELGRPTINGRGCIAILVEADGIPNRRFRRRQGRGRRGGYCAWPRGELRLGISHRKQRENRMTTRQAELQRVLGSLADEISQAEWVALVDQNGLMVSSVPADPPADSDRIAAMTAAVAQTAERVLAELEGGRLRFATVTGAKRQHLTVFLSSDRLLAIGLAPDAEAQSVIPHLMRWVPELIQVLKQRYASE